MAFLKQGSEQLGCKLYNTRKWIGATEVRLYKIFILSFLKRYVYIRLYNYFQVVTVLSWLRINCQLVDFHRPTSSDGRHPELFNWVLKYFEEQKQHCPPLYLQHQG